MTAPPRGDFARLAGGILLLSPFVAALIWAHGRWPEMVMRALVIALVVVTMSQLIRMHGTVIRR